jgi:hypothetical protein
MPGYGEQWARCSRSQFSYTRRDCRFDWGQLPGRLAIVDGEDGQLGPSIALLRARADFLRRTQKALLRRIARTAGLGGNAGLKSVIGGKDVIQ